MQMKAQADRLIAIDLFCGSGGLTLGLKRAGFTVVAGVESDAASAESYRRNHAEVNLWQQDIRSVDPEAVRRKLHIGPGELHLLAGCPPCQGFSTVRTRRKRVSVNDPRNSLVKEFGRFVKALLPQAILLENVPGLASYHGFTQVVTELTALGYSCKYHIFDAADYGVPQRRKRLVLIGSLHGSIPVAKPVTRALHVRQALAGVGIPGESGDSLHDVAEKRSRRIMSLIRLVPHDGGSRRHLPAKYRLNCHKECDGFTDVYGRMAWDEVAPTITSGCTNPSKGRFLHPEQDRAITPREAALLQGFPRDYFFSLSGGKEHVARLIGNAFPPEFARRFAVEIHKALKN